MSRFAKKFLENMEPYTPGEQSDVPGLVKLNTNENPYPPAPGVRRAMAYWGTFRTQKPLNRYPDPSCGPLIKTLASYYNVEENMVAVGNGSDEILAFAYMAFGEKVICPKISYGFYPVFGEMSSGEVREIPLTKDFRIDPDDYADEEGTIIVANPNAPTGRDMGIEGIEKLLSYGRLVIVDEAYGDMGSESAVPLTGGYDNLLVVRTFSKGRSLAGMRVGYAIGHRELIEDINRIKFSFNPYSLDSVAMNAAVESVKDEKYFRETLDKIVRTRQWFAGEMEALGFEVLPSAANFVMTSGPVPGREYFEKLRERNILIRYFDKDPIRDYVRITIGTEDEMKKLLEATKEILNESR